MTHLGEMVRGVMPEAGYVGSGAMLATPETATNIGDTGYTTTSPELRFPVQFATTGTYHVWLRMWAPDGGGNSAHAGLDGAAVTSADRIETLTFGSWVWNKNTMDGAPATLSITSAGIHTVNLWMREDGLYVDRILLTTNASYTPTGNGPAEGPIATATPTATWTPSPTATFTPTTSPTPTSTPSTPPPPPSGQVWTQYYFAGGQRIAMRVRDGARNDLYFLLSDHLGSTALTVTDSGLPLGEMRYKPWGEARFSSGSTLTDYRYTGQREEEGIGLYYYRARWYDPVLGRFAQADSIVPGMGNPISLDRYAYAWNNPIRFTDATGHNVDCSLWEQDCAPIRGLGRTGRPNATATTTPTYGPSTPTLEGSATGTGTSTPTSTSSPTYKPPTPLGTATPLSTPTLYVPGPTNTPGPGAGIDLTYLLEPEIPLNDFLDIFDLYPDPNPNWYDPSLQEPLSVIQAVPGGQEAVGVAQAIATLRHVREAFNFLVVASNWLHGLLPEPTFPQSVPFTLP